MVQTKAGGAKVRQKLLAKNPNYFREIGKKGGKAPHSTPRGFAASPETARIAGAKGGRISKRKKKDENNI